MTITVVDEDTGEITNALDAATVDRLVDRANTLNDAFGAEWGAVIDELWVGRGWLAGGFDSWRSFVAVRLHRPPTLDRAERREAVAGMDAKGMSQPAIAAALGVSQSTVCADLQAIEIDSLPNPDAPTTTTGTDGKTYPRKSRRNRKPKTTAPAPPPEEPAAVAARQRAARLFSSTESIITHLRRIAEEDDVPQVVATLSEIRRQIDAAITELTESHA